MLLRERLEAQCWPLLLALAACCSLRCQLRVIYTLHYTRWELVFAAAAESVSQVSAITWAIITSCGSPLAQNAVYQG